MKKVFGGLCIGSFILAIAACLAGHPNLDKGKNHTSLTIVNPVPEDSRTEKTEGFWQGFWGQEQKASSLEVMSTDNCKYCRRMKVVVLRLISEGYDVRIVHSDDDQRGTRVYPTLYYLDSDGWVTRMEEGFRTRDHVVKYLEK